MLADGIISLARLLFSSMQAWAYEISYLAPANWLQEEVQSTQIPIESAMRNLSDWNTK